MLRFLPLAILLSIRSLVFGQISTDGIEKLKAYEDTLRNLSEITLRSDSDSYRVRACYSMIPKLVEALKIPGSFKYPFTSLENMSILYPKDSSFRIFDWVLSRDDGSYRYFGAIQKKNLKKLELIPLYDWSDSIFSPADTVLTSETWFGALYYNIYDVKVKGKTYYMLFGWDGNDLVSTRKLIDVLSFDNNGKAKFGAPLFDMGDTSNDRYPKRFILEFKKDATVTLNYSDDYKMIIFDHLVAQSEKTSDLGFTLMPDGSYDGFKWKGDLWHFVDNAFSDVIDDKKNVPVPFPQTSHSMTDPGKKP